MKKLFFHFFLFFLPLTANADDSGKCGDNLTWTYVEATQTLTISGSGEMYNFSFTNYSNTNIPWYKYASTIVSITMKEGVNSIGNYAFNDCISLTSINIPNSVTSLGECAFYGCSSLTSIDIPNSVTSIGSTAFSACKSLVSINIPNNIKRIEFGTFYLCSSLASISIPNNVTSIGNSAFYLCTSLNSINLPNSLTSIEASAFNSCQSLTSINIPENVSSIGINPFSRCSSLVSITVSPNNSFYDSRDNCNAIIEKSTKTLISGCQSSFIPNDISSIGDLAFYGCVELSLIIIPDKVINIGESSFKDCTSLTSVEIPNSVKKIGQSAFQGCNSITSIIFGNSLETIGDIAFLYCNNLRTITALGKEPPIVESNTFPNRSKQTLYVPKGCKSVYYNVDYWWEFKEIIELGSSSSGIKGDVNGDGYVNMLDVTEIINIILGKEQ